jgi:hypothetical protein
MARAERLTETVRTRVPASWKRAIAEMADEDPDALNESDILRRIIRPIVLSRLTSPQQRNPVQPEDELLMAAEGDGGSMTLGE